MNPPSEPTRESVFVFRRLSESFAQFREDVWGSLVAGPLFLLIVALVAVAARGWYAWYCRKTRGPTKPDATLKALGWASVLTTLGFVGWWLVEFYHRDCEQLKAGVTQLSALGEANKTYWRVFVGGLFALGALFVGLMYVRDARTVRWYWAVKLALVRTTVYAVLCFVFLLPSRETWDRSQRESRVVVLIDITPSVTRHSDEIVRVEGTGKTRMEVLIEFLTDKDIAFVQGLLKTNPVVLYPFGSRLDDVPQGFSRRDKDGNLIEYTSNPWTAADWKAFAEYDFRPFMTQGLDAGDKKALANTTNPVPWNGPAPTPPLKRLEPANWAEWVAKWVAFRAEWVARKARFETEKQGSEPFTEKLVNGISEAGNRLLADNIERLEKRVEFANSIAEGALAKGTNVPNSVAAAIDRESPYMVQGVVVFSDMRSNLGSDASYRELRAAAAREKIPVFMVAVGEDRERTSISITDVLTDSVASPDEGFKVSVAADGVNLAGKTVPVELDVFLPGRDPKADKPNFTLKDSRKDKTQGSATPYTLTFAPGDPPHGEVEFSIVPDDLAKDPDPDARSLVTDSTDAAIKKKVLKEGTWAVRARIPRDADEAFPNDFHQAERPGIQVIQKKLRVLMVGGAPGREFQFLRTFLNREVAENRAELSVLIQNEAGLGGNLTPNPTERLLRRFPTRLDLSGRAPADGEEKPYNLNEYDVIIGFDPDWTELSAQQAEDLQLWVERQGGGLILVADRINTYQLARVEEKSRLSPILEILPVKPDDVVALKIKPTPRTPRRLYLHPLPASDLLKIDDPPAAAKGDGAAPANDPVAGWESFFTDRTTYAKSNDYKVELYPRRGFFSCYPVKDVKPGAHVLAEFADVDDQNQTVLRPYIVVSNPAAGFRTAYMASGEMYRMYAHDKDYYERYWAKMIKYMASKRNAEASRGRVITTKQVIAGQPLRVTAQLLNTSSKPYPPGAIDPKFKIQWTAPNGDPKEEGPYPLTGTGVDGYYKGQVNIDPKLFPPGETKYFAVVDVPDSANEKKKSDFKVLKSDIEMDVTKPDFAAWLAMATPVDTLSAGVPDTVRQKFLTGLPKEAGVPKLAFRISEKALLKLIPECFKTVTSSNEVRGPIEDLWDERVVLFDIHSPDTQAWLARNGFRAKVERNERAATPLGDFFARGPRVFRSSANDTPPAEDVPDTDEAGNVKKDANGADVVVSKPIPARAPNSQVAISWVLLVVVFLLCWEWLTRKLLRLA